MALEVKSIGAPDSLDINALFPEDGDPTRQKNRKDLVRNVAKGVNNRDYEAAAILTKILIIFHYIRETVVKNSGIELDMDIVLTRTPTGHPELRLGIRKKWKYLPVSRRRVLILTPTGYQIVGERELSQNLKYHHLNYGSANPNLLPFLEEFHRALKSITELIVNLPKQIP